LIILERHYGPDHVEVAITLVNLGTAYGDLGDAKQMKAFLERALIIQEWHYGPDHVEVARTLTNLGNAYGDLGDMKQKKALLERALIIKERHYGPDHVEVGITVFNLSIAYYVLHQLDTARNICQRALTIFGTQKHPHEETARRALQEINQQYQREQQHSVLSLVIAGQFLAQGNINAAIQSYEKYQSENSNAIDHLHNLACCYAMQNQTELAEETFARAMSANPTPDVYAEYGHFLYNLKRYQDAIDVLLQVFPGKEETLEYGKAALVQLDLTLQQLATNISGEKPLITSVEILKHYLLVQCYRALNLDLETARCLSAFQELAETKNDPLAWHLLAAIYEQMGDASEAKLCYKKAKPESTELTDLMPKLSM